MKALIGAWDHRPTPLLAEVAALRNRVVELERALARTEQENLALRESLREQDEIEVALSAG